MHIQSVLWLATSDPAADATLRFAAEELARYLHDLTGDDYESSRASAFDGHGDAHWLGLCDWLPQPKEVSLRPSLWDDGYAIWASKGQLFLAGKNHRSVLYGVYDLLARQGIRFVRPGASEEIIPHRDVIWLPETPLVEEAHYRHRGVCIEGAPSLEHALGMVDWCAKKRMNSILLQFFTDRYFFQRWYGREYNPQFADHDVSDSEAMSLDRQVIAAIKQRGMILHQVGHGWTSLALGLPRSGWVTTSEEVPRERRRWLAQVDGERKLYKGIPLNTELCYSHRPARDAFVGNVVRFCQTHPEVDVVHVWLSDAPNNKCECADCRELSISDWYATLVNELSCELYKHMPGKRFVFLCYFELWWPPQRVALDERYGNAIMMFAPITRCYGHELWEASCDDGMAHAEPALNQLVYPRSNTFFARSLASWRAAFQGDSFDFDYHIKWANWRQLTDTALARTFHTDLGRLKGAGLNGLVNCQSFRTFYPTGLPLAILTEGLWDPSQSWQAQKQRYYRDAYGKDAKYVGQYLERIESGLATGDPHRKHPPLDGFAEDELAEMRGFLIESRATLAGLRDRADEPVHARSLDILAYHTDLLLLLIAAHLADRSGDECAASKALDATASFLRRTEPEFHQVIDTQLMLDLVVEETRERWSLRHRDMAPAAEE